MPTWGWLTSPKSTAGDGAAATEVIVVVVVVDDDNDDEEGAPRRAADDGDNDDNEDESAGEATEEAATTAGGGGAMLPTTPVGGPMAEEDMARLPRARPMPPPPARLPRARATGKFVGGCAAPAAIENAACSAPPIKGLQGLLSDSDKALASFACCLSVSDTAMVHRRAAKKKEEGRPQSSQDRAAS